MSSSPLLHTIDDVWKVSVSDENFHLWMLEIKNYLDLSPSIFFLRSRSFKPIKGVLISVRDHLTETSERSILPSKELDELRIGSYRGSFYIFPVSANKDFSTSSRMYKRPFYLRREGKCKTLCVKNLGIGVPFVRYPGSPPDLDPSYGTSLRDLLLDKVVITEYQTGCYEYSIFLTLENFETRLRRRFAATKSAYKTAPQV